MKKLAVLATAVVAALVGGVSIAGAAGETTAINYSAKPIKGKFNAKKFLPANISWGVKVSPAAGSPTILPMTVADLKFPNNKVMRFVPRKGLKPCKITRESGGLEVPPSKVYSGACGKSVIGNGTATFALSKNTAPANNLAGSVVVLYGGMERKNVKIKFSAWSNDTGAGVYAEGVLLPSGKMYIAMPILTYDSAVTSLQLNMPGKKTKVNWRTGGSAQLKAGLDRNFVRVKCKTGKTLPISGALTLQARNTDTEQPVGEAVKTTPRSTSKCGR